MKNYKNLLMALVAVAGFSACDTDNLGPTYTPTTQNVSFEMDELSTVKTSESSYTVQVRVTRSITTTAYSAHYTLSSEDEGIFTDGNSGTVDFAAGQGAAYVSVTANNMEKGNTYVCTLTLSDADAAQADATTNTAVTATTFSVMCDYNWVNAGSGTFEDVLWNETSYKVKIQHAEGTNIYRIKAAEDDLDFTLADDGTVDFEEGAVYSYASYCQMYWLASRYPQYCYVTNNNGHIECASLIYYNSSLYPMTSFGLTDYIWALDWTDGYPLK